LSRLANLLVLSSNITFKYRGQKVTLQSLKKELNVDFVVQGSVRRVGQEMRINVQLVNVRTGVNLWAERYDRKLEDVFSVQDEITDKLIDTLSIKLTSVEKQRLAQRTTNNLMAYDFFLEGQRISKEGTRQANQLAAEAYRKAIEQDATYGRAFSALAFILAVDFRRGWTDAPIETLDRALALAEQGVALDDSIPHTYWGLGYVHLMRKEFTKAEQAAAKSISIAPNYADGYGLLALIYNNLGEPEKAVEFVEKGMKINPYYTWDYLFNLGWAHYMLGSQDKAIEALEKAQQRNESVVPIKLILAASYAHAGRQDDAEWTVDQLLILNPMTTLSHTENAMPIAKPELKQQLLDDLRKAGLPE
jgi:tetratricopeptide (TPR) repeat protein